MLTDSAYRPLVQCQPSITEVSKQLFQFSVINGKSLQAPEFDDFAAVSRRISWAGPQDLAEFSVENSGP